MGVISTALHRKYIGPEGGEGHPEWGWGCLQGHPFLGWRMEQGGEDGGDGCDNLQLHSASPEPLAPCMHVDRCTEDTK